MQKGSNVVVDDDDDDKSKRDLPKTIISVYQKAVIVFVRRSMFTFLTPF